MRPHRLSGFFRARPEVVVAPMHSTSLFAPAVSRPPVPQTVFGLSLCYKVGDALLFVIVWDHFPTIHDRAFHPEGRMRPKGFVHSLLSCSSLQACYGLELLGLHCGHLSTPLLCARGYQPGCLWGLILQVYVSNCTNICRQKNVKVRMPAHLCSWLCACSTTLMAGVRHGRLFPLLRSDATVLQSRTWKLLMQVRLHDNVTVLATPTTFHVEYQIPFLRPLNV